MTRIFSDKLRLSPRCMRKKNTHHSLPITHYLLLFALCSLVLSGCGKKKLYGPQTLTLPRGKYDTIKMANGAIVSASVQHLESSNNALLTADTADAYKLNINLQVAIPRPALTIANLSAATPEITTALPELESMLPHETNAPFFTTLYEHKINSLERQLWHLGQLPSRDSLYDCQTILSLTNPKTHHRALLVQAIMNVNADGSDGDRNIPLEKLSSTYQPQTNYRWPKISSRPNPNIPDVEKERTLLQQSLRDATLTSEQKNKLQQQLSEADAMLLELHRWSFLIGSADPFIVLPKFMLDKNNMQAAAIGDYAVVLYHGTLYPAIVGDIGPGSKIGEASLRLCRSIDPKSGAEHRPADGPHVCYFVFPGSADQPFTAPDYAHWSERCHQLWSDFGGATNLTWHEWTSIEQPWPEEKSEQPAEKSEAAPTTNGESTNSLEVKF